MHGIPVDRFQIWHVWVRSLNELPIEVESEREGVSVRESCENLPTCSVCIHLLKHVFLRIHPIQHLPTHLLNIALIIDLFCIQIYDKKV